MTTALLVSLLLSAAPTRSCAEDIPCEEQPVIAEPERSVLVPALHSLTLIGGMRLSLWIMWPPFYDPFTFRENAARFREAWTRPPEFRSERSLFESDGDPWALNVIGHGLFGSEVYQRTRHCGFGPLGAAVAVTAASTFWEYGPEAFHKRPSAIDLAWTPLSGVAFGELRYQAYRWAHGDGARPAGARGVLLYVFDPFGEFERQVLGTRC